MTTIIEKTKEYVKKCEVIFKRKFLEIYDKFVYEMISEVKNNYYNIARYVIRA